MGERPELTRSTRAESLTFGTGISPAKKMPFSSSKKTKIEIDDTEIVEEHIREVSKFGSEDYSDFAEEEIRIEDELPEQSSRIKG